MLSHVTSLDRWWQPAALPDPTAAIRQKELRFRNGDPFERFALVRYAIIALSIITPAIILKTARFAPRGGVHHDWSADPMQEVQRSLQSGQQHTALASLKAEAERSPDNPEILRALATLAADISPADARRCYHRLNALGLATDADYAGHAALLAKLHDFTGAKAVLSNISKEAQAMPQAQYAWLAIWREAGDFAAVADTLDKLTAQAPCDVEIVLDLVRKASAAKTPVELLGRIEASLLKSLRHWMSSGRAQDVLPLARQMASLPVSSTVHRTHMAQILRNLPGTPVQHRLAAVRFALPLQLSTADQIQLRTDYQNEIAWSGGLSAEDKENVAAYLQSQNEHSLVTSIISDREALTEPRLFARRFDSLLELGSWREAGAMNAAREAPLLPRSRAVAQALATLQKRMSRSHTVEILLNEALVASQRENRALDCYAVGCAAIDHTLPTLAASAFATALDISTDRAKTMQAIMRSARQGRLPLDILMRSLIGSPAMQDESIQESLIYLSLLSGQKVDGMLAVIRSRRQTTPDNVYLRFLEALALHQQGNHFEAAGLLIPLPQYRWHQGEAAVLASIIASAGKIDRTSALIQQIDVTQLLPEEHTLFDPWRNRVSLGNGLLGSVGEK
ncbi:hypothetical protein [Prosthecobacter sp.]|uniref:hypothetical protein n=1 Tax=Prosthecobacter sp. TaxID=1965333 RepID=UPI0037851939